MGTVEEALAQTDGDAEDRPPGHTETVESARKRLYAIFAPSTGRRETSKREKQFAIRVAALALFRDHGIARVTVDQIAQMAEVSPRTFFNYFSTKEECVLFPYELLAPAFEAYLRAQPAGAPSLSVIGDGTAMLFDQLVEFPGVTEAIRVGAAMQKKESSLLAANRVQMARWEDVAYRSLLERGEDPVSARIIAVCGISAQLVSIVEWSATETTETLPAYLRHGFELLKIAAIESSAPGFPLSRFAQPSATELPGRADGDLAYSNSSTS